MALFQQQIWLLCGGCCRHMAQCSLRELHARNDDDVRSNPNHCNSPVAPTYLVWAYYAHGRQRRCQEDPASLPSGGLKKTTRSSPHHVAQLCPTRSETMPPYAPRSSRFGSEPPSVEDVVDIWRNAVLESCMPETTTT